MITETGEIPNKFTFKVDRVARDLGQLGKTVDKDDKNWR